MARRGAAARARTPLFVAVRDDARFAPLMRALGIIFLVALVARRAETPRRAPALLPGKALRTCRFSARCAPGVLGLIERLEGLASLLVAGAARDIRRAALLADGPNLCGLMLLTGGLIRVGLKLLALATGVLETREDRL